MPETADVERKQEPCSAAAAMQALQQAEQLVKLRQQELEQARDALQLAQRTFRRLSSGGST
jgi:hypothetical protein